LRGATRLKIVQTFGRFGQQMAARANSPGGLVRQVPLPVLQAALDGKPRVVTERQYGASPHARPKTSAPHLGQPSLSIVAGVRGEGGRGSYALTEALSPTGGLLGRQAIYARQGMLGRA